MAQSDKKRPIKIIGVALEGRSGSPLVFFVDPISGAYLSVETDPYEADLLIRDYIGEAEDSSVAWLADILVKKLSRRFPHRTRAYAALELGDEGSIVVSLILNDFRRSDKHFFRLGEGLALVRRLGLRLNADPDIVPEKDDELVFLSSTSAFQQDFLYLTPPPLSTLFPNG